MIVRKRLITLLFFDRVLLFIVILPESLDILFAHRATNDNNSQHAPIRCLLIYNSNNFNNTLSAVSDKRLQLAAQSEMRNELKVFYRGGLF